MGELNLGWKQPKPKKTNYLGLLALIVLVWVLCSIILTYASNTDQIAVLSLSEPLYDYNICDRPEIECNYKTPEEIIREIGGKHTEYLLKLAMCESSMRPDVRGVVDGKDRGLFQINSRWNPEVSDECAFDVRCSTLWVISELEKGNAWKWSASKRCLNK